MPIEDDALKYREDDRDGFLTDYMVFNRYSAESGVYMTGITSPEGFQGQSAAFIQLSTETMVQAADWTAARAGDRPTIPDPVLLNPDWVLLRKMPELAMVTLCADGQTPFYRVNGTYLYGKRQVGKESLDNVTFPRPAWLADTEQRLLPAEFRQKGIIDIGGQNQSQQGTTSRPNYTGQLTGYITRG